MLTICLHNPRIDIAYKAAAVPVTFTHLALGQLCWHKAAPLSKLVKEKEMLTGVGGFMDEKRGIGALHKCKYVRT
jgi:hypothetical protein